MANKIDEQKWAEYNEAVMTELEILGFPEYAFLAHKLGLPDEVTVTFMILMGRAFMLQGKTPQEAAKEIHKSYAAKFSQTLDSIIMSSIKFPSE